MPARKKVDGDIVRQVRLQGNGGLLSGQNNRQLRLAMEQRQSPPLTFVWPFMYVMQGARLDQDALQLDGRRIEVWYAHHGWFDAAFYGWQVRRVRRRYADRAGVVDILGHVDPGPPSFVREVDIQGAGMARSVIRGALREVPIESGGQFNLDTLEEARQNLVAELQENGFAYGRAEMTFDVYPGEYAVDVDVEIDPGIIAKFGDVTVEGLDKIEVERVLDSLTFSSDDRDAHGNRKFRPSLLRSSQQRIFETNYFSLVDIVPDLSDPTVEEIPITVRVAETAFRRFRLGAGLEFDYFNVSPQLSLEIRDVRFAGTGLRAELHGDVGAVIDVTTVDGSGVGAIVTGGSELRFEYPWLMRRRLSLGGGIRVVRGAQFGDLPYLELAADFQLRRTFGAAWAFSMGPRFSYFQYDGDVVGEGARLLFGGEFAGTNYRLLTMDLGLSYDTRDNKLAARRGSFATIELRQALPIPAFDGSDLDNAFLFTELGVDLRRWWRVIGRGKAPPIVFAVRGQATVMVPWAMGDRFTALPYPELAFLGGPNSLRGFRSNQVGGYDAVCVYEGGRPRPQHNNGELYSVDTTYLPHGGAFAAQLSAEMRVEWKYGLSFATFADAGVLSRRVEDLGTADFLEDMFRYSAGVGIRSSSPIGPIRLDVGLRPLFREDREGPTSVFNCNTLDRIPRPYDVVSAFQNPRRLRGDPLPLGINIFLAIGEAF